MEVSGTLGRQFAQLLLDRNELNAVLASLTGSLGAVERGAGRDTAVWTLLNSLRTAFAEASYGLEEAEQEIPIPPEVTDEAYQTPWTYTQSREVLDRAWDALMEATVTHGNLLDGVFVQAVLAGFQPYHISRIFDLAITAAKEEEQT